MGQLDMFEKARRLNVVGVHEHEFLVLGRCAGILLAKLAPAERAVDQAHRDGLAFGLAEDKAVAAGELGRLGA